MTAAEITEIIEKQRAYFLGGNTLNIKTRKGYLLALQKAIKAHEGEILSALYSDLKKSEQESYMCEVGMALNELKFQLAHINKFAKRKRVKTPLAQFKANSYLYPSPYGVTLIMSPWNYPFLLSVQPLIEAVAAGNTAVLKPSAYSPATSAVVKNILEEVFPKELVSVVTGGREENKCLLDAKFDYIFFTGSKNVGKLVYESAARNLTPLTLELGGKSPCIVDESAKIELAARRIVFGKFLNCGQTCVAPDYILCQKQVKPRLMEALKREIVRQFGENALENKDYGKMISEKHFSRVKGLIAEDKVIFGGKVNEETLQIQPTLMDNVTLDDAVMGEEIFGPVLPVLTYETIDEVIALVNSHESPLALYLFTTNKKQAERVINSCRFGGGCINDVIIHVASDTLAFGGFGASGLGAYHGKKGFETFTHYKGVVSKSNAIDLSMRYQPYKKSALKLIRKFLK